MNWNQVQRYGLLIVIFILFLLVRVFVTSPYYFIAMDEAKYLTLARNFPHHTLFNDQLYLVHPPGFPYLIRLFSLVLPDHIAGMTVSFFFAAVTFFALIKLFRLFGKDSYWIAIALFPLAISPLHISTSRVIYKDSIFFGLFTLSLFFYLKGLIKNDRHYLYGAGLIGAVGFLTSDITVILLPSFGLAYLLFHGPNTRLKDALVPFIVMIAAYSLWIIIRIIVFKNNPLYPVGVDGTIEYVRDFTLRQLFTPRYFPATATMFNFSADLSEFRINANVYPLKSLSGIPGILYLITYIFIGTTTIFSIARGLIQKKIRNNEAVYFSGLLIIFFIPVILHPEPRFLIPILIPISFLFAHGITLITGIFRRPERTRRIIALILVLTLTILTGIYLAGHRNLIFSLQKEVEIPRTAEFIRNLPDEGVMAQVGYPPELAYLTGKRILALPITPRVLDDFIRRYKISYLLYGQHYLAPIHTDDPSLIWCYHTIKYIREHPEHYPLFKVINEVYRSGAPPDRIFIHGIN
ncbi:MAG: glycosyltransferase family 39 protein [Candidatus Auribacterota bacterium]|nr:glycosyltransferase family 39 protein [Candidatus Auribacterota bacterium]